MSNTKTVKANCLAIEQEGGKILSVEDTHGTHVYIWFEYQGRKLRALSPSSGSDSYRGLKNFRADIRRIIKGVGSYKQREKA